MQFARARALIKSTVDTDGATTISLPSNVFRDLLIGALRAKAVFDADFYVNSYPDVRHALDKKMIEGAAEHYYTTGYFESRMPKKILVDEKFYLQNNPDVASAIKEGTVTSAQDHFEIAGFEEGRLPYAGFSLF